MKAIATILSVLALASFTANAADEGAKKDGAKKKGDPAKAFAKLDANSDGSLSKEEFMASPQAKKDSARAEKGFGMKDKNKDGKLSKEEFTAAPKKKKKAE
jgi:Ca2+-binding EF-hand superfamily protein